MAHWDITRVPPSADQSKTVRRLEKEGWEAYTTTPNGEVNLKRRSGYVPPKPKPKRKPKAKPPTTDDLSLPVEVEVEPEINHSEDT